MVDVTEWEPEAERWVRWARTPGHDAYWYFRDAFFELVPPPGRRTIELGCGEGRVARDLAERGHHVLGVEPSRTLARHARAADDVGAYVVADGAAVPAASGAFDLVVAYNSLQVVADMRGTVREAARMLRTGGHLCVTVSHPAMDLGRFIEGDGGIAFTVRPGYFESLARRRHDRDAGTQRHLPRLDLHTRGLRDRVRVGRPRHGGVARAQADRALATPRTLERRAALLDGPPAEAALSGPAPVQPVVVVVDVVTETLPSGVIPDVAMAKPAPVLSVHFMPVVCERHVIEPRVIDTP